MRLISPNFFFLIFALCGYNLILETQSRKGLGANCKAFSDCPRSTLCHKKYKVCSCPELFDYGIGIVEEQLYIRGECYSRINQQCAIINATSSVKCIPGSHCVRITDTDSKCACIPKFVSIDSGKRCISVTDIILTKLPRGSSVDNDQLFNSVKSFTTFILNSSIILCVIPYLL